MKGEEEDGGRGKEGRREGGRGSKEMLTFSNNTHRIVYSLECHLVRNMYRLHTSRQTANRSDCTPTRRECPNKHNSILPQNEGPLHTLVVRYYLAKLTSGNFTSMSAKLL